MRAESSIRSPVMRFATTRMFYYQSSQMRTTNQLTLQPNPLPDHPRTPLVHCSRSLSTLDKFSLGPLPLPKLAARVFGLF